VNYIRSNMGLVHGVGETGRVTVCGIVLKQSWEPVEVDDWSREANVCCACDNVLMMRGRRASRA
jgi:hypothetical protein